MAKKGGLGRGLDSLFSENSYGGNSAVELRISEVEPNKNQPRTSFNEEALEELAESIKAQGLLQPIVVRPLSNGGYQIVAGERRWRACRKAGLSTIKATVMELTDQQTAELALIENLQRENLNPVEEAEGYKYLIETSGITQEAAADKVHKSRSYVSNSLRILNLDKASLNALKNGKITLGHAKALLAVKDEKLRALALKAAINGASVREIENIKPPEEKNKIGGSNKKESIINKDSFYKESEIILSNALHRKAKINVNEKNKGTVTIEFFNKDELKAIVELLSKKEW